MYKASGVFPSLVLAGSILALTSGAAQADIMWGGDGSGPVLGYQTTIGGAGAGTLTVRTDGGTITLPNYNLVGDPLYQVGGPSQYRFLLTGPNGVGVGQAGNVQPGSYVYINGTGSYDMHETWTYLGDNGPVEVLTGGSWDCVGCSGLLTDSGLLTAASGIHDFWTGAPGESQSEVGRWTYTETWVNVDPTRSSDMITMTVPFCVGDPAVCSSSAVPEPASFALLALGLAGLGFTRRSKQV